MHINWLKSYNTISLGIQSIVLHVIAFDNDNNLTCSLKLEMYLKDLHKECLNGLALVYHSLTAYFQAANLFRINPILIKKRCNNCQTEIARVNL